MITPADIEKGAKAEAVWAGRDWGNLTEGQRQSFRDRARSVLDATQPTEPSGGEMIERFDVAFRELETRWGKRLTTEAGQAFEEGWEAALTAAKGQS